MVPKSWSATLKVTFAYVVFAGLWILYSDMAVDAMFDDPRAITRVQTFKGWLFVIITALLLFIMVLRNYQRVERAFQVDGLTGLLSHHVFQLQLEHRLQTIPSDQILVVGYLDIDDFKELNQAIGFDRADHFLIQLAENLEAHNWRAATIGRLPPDQFAVVHECDSAASINEFANSFQSLFDRTASKMGIEASCSIGIAVYPEDGESAKELMNATATALAAAKRSGTSIQYHDKRLSEQTSRRREMLDGIRAAIDSKSFSVVYQPKYVIGTGASSGVEVLIRWHHPIHGYISPAEFIPLAEEHGLSHAISTQVLESVARELGESELLGTLVHHVSINISATEFNEVSEMDRLMACIRKYPRLMPYLRIEITETATLTDMQQSIAITNKLREAGLGISIDDFGTGYTSLAMLKDFPIDEIKIDRSFVSGLESDGRSRTIVEAIIAMASSFDINVVAEGVETQGQLDTLAGMGCLEAQGFLLGVPMPLVALEEHLAPEAPSLGRC